MATFTIGEVAARSGFSTSALRYYEDIGLVRPASRTDGGYRVYDDATLARLAFIARTKQLGCSLEEIADLVEVWELERCAPVQRRLHEHVTEGLARARDQMGELRALTDQLNEAAAHLSGPPLDGPCGDACACLRDTALAEPPTIACTLAPDDVPARLDAWRAVVARALGRSTSKDGTVHLELGPALDLAELAALVAAEQACCSFLTFTLVVGPEGTTLAVHTPDGGAEVIAALLADTAC